MEDKRLRNIPSVNDILEDKMIRVLVEDKGRNVVKNIIVSTIEQYRSNIVLEGNNISEKNVTKEDARQSIINKVLECIKLNEKKRLGQVINATGIILHTNMGRAPLPEKALEKIMDVARGYCNLEYDLVNGKRGSRYDSVEDLLIGITGAESALVVNNNAAAVFLCLNTLAYDKEVIVSRSEQVEIGGSFRVPDIVERSNAKMVEVGTTNKTYIRDYRNAITEDTKVLLKVHKSNYKIEGFTCEVQGEELVNLAKENEVITIEDLGSGVLVDLKKYELPYEPTVMDLVKKGIDLITFSGDKLLGGPQAGIIVGKQELINQIKSNPLTRMVRIDKLSLIALQEVLSIYLYNNNIASNIPILDMLTKNKELLLADANELKNVIMKKLGNKIELNIIDEKDTTGGGSLPGVVIEGVGLSIICKTINSNVLQKRLREYEIPIICKIKDNSIILSMRTINKNDYNVIVSGLSYVLGR